MSVKSEVNQIIQRAAELISQDRYWLSGLTTERESSRRRTLASALREAVVERYCGDDRWGVNLPYEPQKLLEVAERQVAAVVRFKKRRKLELPRSAREIRRMLITWSDQLFRTQSHMLQALDMALLGQSEDVIRRRWREENTVKESDNA